MLYHDNTVISKLDGRVAEGMFILYGKSDKQYLILQKGTQDMKLVTNPKFHV